MFHVSFASACAKRQQPVDRVLCLANCTFVQKHSSWRSSCDGIYAIQGLVHVYDTGSSDGTMLEGVLAYERQRRVEW